MNWQIERDEKGEPVRLRWLGPQPIKTTLDAQPPYQPFMPAMRDWARAHGLYPEPPEVGE